MYALGATLFHLLAGRAPTTVSVRMSEPARFQTPRAHNPNISPDVERAILRAMEIERAKRFASATDMRRALQLASGLNSVESGQTTHLPAPDRPTRPAGHRSPWVALIVIGVLAISGVTLGLLDQRGAGQPPAPTAHAARSAVKITRLEGGSMPEVVVVENSGDADQNLSGWYLESTIGPQTFNFPGGYILAAGGALRIESYTGARNDPPGTLFWTIDPIWRNAGDKAVLRDTAGAAISTQCYGDACP